MVFQDKLVTNPQDLLHQNNIMLRQYLQSNSVERHESLFLASKKNFEIDRLSPEPPAKRHIEREKGGSFKINRTAAMKIQLASEPDEVKKLPLPQ